MILGVIVVVAVVNYWMLIPTVVMLFLFFMLRTYYIATSRSIKRLEGISKLIVFLWFTLYLTPIVCIVYLYKNYCFKFSCLFMSHIPYLLGFGEDDDVLVFSVRISFIVFDLS
jgi:hypothetical protein